MANIDSFDYIDKLIELQNKKLENLNIDSNIDLEELSLNDTIFPLANDDTTQLIVTKNYDSPITYKSSDEAIATVSETGLITKLANGEATITVEAGPKSTTAKVVNLITKDSNVLPLLNIPYLHSRGIKGQGVKVAIFENFVIPGIISFTNDKRLLISKDLSLKNQINILKK